MIIPIELRFEADKDSKSALRTEKTIKSHDVNSVEFHISIDGLELTDNHTAKILSVFHSSKSQANVDCEIVEGGIIYKPDTNLISRHEHVTNYVYVYHNNQSLDVREFIYTVDLSKIDETSLEVKEVYDQSYADLLADFEQALSDYKDNLPQADSVRADIDEILNKFSEDSQAKLSQYDTVAQQVITDNQTAFDLAESVRQEDFDTSQSEKQKQFDDAQSARQESYEQTQSLINEAEESRVQAEGQRESAESSRVSAESGRVLAESERQANETERQENETTRRQAESQRASAESDRESAEEQRKIDHANRSAELDAKADKVVIKNLIENGNFSSDVIPEIFAGGWYPSNQAIVEDYGRRSLKITKHATGNTRAFIGRNDLKPNHMYLFEGLTYSLNTNGGNLWFSKSLSGVGTTSIVRKAGEWARFNVITRVDSKGVLMFGGNILEDNPLYFDDVQLTDLTETFGAGNEPTKEEMDELIKVTGYIDGEYALNNKEMLIWILALIRRNTNAMIALGGA